MPRKNDRQVWEKYWASENHQPRVIHRELLKNLMAVIAIKNKKILEIGAGMGGDSFYLAKKEARVTVLDNSPKALEAIRGNAQKEKIRLETILADAKQIPFKSETFDIVFHQGFLEHFHDPMTFLKEQRRVLKKEAILVVDVPQRFTTYTLKKHWLILRKKWFAGWEREYSISELENLIRGAGFKILKSYGWGYYGKLHQLRYLRMGSWYEKFWQKIEKTRLKLYLNWCIGVVARKQ